MVYGHYPPGAKDLRINFENCKWMYFNGARIVFQSIVRSGEWAQETGIKGLYGPLLKSSKTLWS